MLDTLKEPRKFLKRWYVRYLLATELYMVEPWEKVVIHVLFAMCFGLFWYFNYSMLVNGFMQRDTKIAV